MNFEIIFFNSVTKPLAIYADATTSVDIVNPLYSNSKIPIATLKVNHMIPPNIRPSFKQKLKDQNFVITPTENEFEYTFPGVFDPEGDDWGL